MSRTRPPHGFTLIEMLVVMAIITLLAAMIFPTFRSARNTAKEKACMSKLQALGQAVKQYHLDNKKHPRTLTDLQKYLDFQVSGSNFTAGSDKFLDPVDLRSSSTALRSSFGGFGGLVNNPPAAVPLNPAQDCATATLLADNPENCPRSTNATYFGTYDATNPSASSALPSTFQVHWNYWGYDNAGIAYCRTNAAPCGAAGQSPYYQYQAVVAAGGAPGALPAGIAGWATYPALANRNAPDNTIITRCNFHRPVRGRFDLATASWDGNAGDIILRLGGDAKYVALDKMSGKWRSQTE